MKERTKKAWFKMALLQVPSLTSGIKYSTFQLHPSMAHPKHEIQLKAQQRVPASITHKSCA
jgi:hypothetical protein